MTMPATHRTVADVIAFVKRQFGDESGVQLIDSDIIRWTNQAQTEIVNKNPLLQSTATTTVAAGANGLSMPSNMLRLESVWWNNVILQAKNFENVGDVAGSNMAAQGDPEIWYKWAGQIYLWPVPSKQGTMTVYYSSLPLTVTTSADLLSVADRYFDRVCEYVMSKAYELDEDWAAHKVNKQAFEDKLTEATNADNNQQGSFLVAVDPYYE